MKKIFILLSLTAFIFIMLSGCTTPEPYENKSINLSENDNNLEFIQAENLEDIELALQSSSQSYSYDNSRISFGGEMLIAESAAMGESTKAAPSDFSTTNVQVFGIDELDTIKLDSVNGNKMYYLNGNKLNLINSFPAEDMELYKTIETEYGNGIYEYKDSIMSISHNKIEVFDKTGKEEWHADLNSTYLNSRMKDGIVYLVLQEYPNSPYTPRPMQVCNGICKQIEIDYSNVYIPRNMDTNMFYDIISIELETGKVLDTKTFMGPYSSTIYVSENSIYFGMYSIKSDNEVMFYYFLEEGKNLISNSTYNRLVYLNGLDISDQAKAVEFSLLMHTLYQGLTLEEKAELQNDIQKGYSAYLSKYPERKEYTGILKIEYDKGDLDIDQTAKVPGRLLNQFSMDEYNAHLRVAFTFDRGGDSQNGLVILNEEMNEVSRITELAEGERIYAIRFIGKMGYMVTYRQVDPLFVIDLSNPLNPEVKGELKVPGYSTYLHPIGNDKLIGIGKDDRNVKISLFDVSNLSDPKELDSFITEERWSEALYNHHAFLWNPNENFVVLPLGAKDYVFEITNEIKMKKIINEDAVRNLYTDNILYVTTKQHISAYSMDDFSEIKQIDVEGNDYYGPRSGYVIDEA